MDTNTYERDFLVVNADNHRKIIDVIGELGLPRFILKNVTEYMRNPGFYMLQVALLSLANEGEGVYIYIDGGGIIASKKPSDEEVEDPLYYTIIYYPIEDKVIGVQHRVELN